jgi:putative ABC transport system ATP-binding protein
MALLTIQQLRKQLGSGEQVFTLTIPSFSLEQGEQLLLQGRSGTGKSTFLNCISGITQSDSGSITIDGKDITALAEAERDRFRACNIGYVFQTFNLLQGFSALDNVLIGTMFSDAHTSTKEEVRTLLANLGLADKIHHKPSELSVGQQQRVAVARALIHKPKLILADEPTANTIGAALLVVSHDQDIISSFSHTKQFSEILD